MPPRPPAPCGAKQSCGDRRDRGLLRPVACALLALAALDHRPAAAQPDVIEAAYVALGSEGAVARAILSGATECPTIDLGGAVRRMSVRAPPDAVFSVLVCEMLIPPETASAVIGGRSLPLPKSSLRTIAGDTGCRLKATKKGKSDHDHDAGRFQACDKPNSWPFARVSATIAARRPDLVIHVGDYLYRESPCPTGDRGCEGSPFGDNWPAWQADFFKPAASLLAAAPWIVVRGNHEICTRGGLGYFRFLHPDLARDHTPPACVDYLAPYTVETGGKSFIVFDSSQAADACADDRCDIAPYADQFSRLRPQPGTWFLSHRPIWGIGRDFITNRTLEQALAKASDGRLPEGIELALSGHMHIFELLTFAGQRPPQLVVGTGGTLLDRPVDRKLRGLTVGSATVNYRRTEHRFGFTIIAPGKTARRRHSSATAAERVSNARSRPPRRVAIRANSVPAELELAPVVVA